mmetsp:Transcript_79619/g.191052  ORF Transcript_79619/g.191052 Transcript_79619/m.191052 type:complete len:206 (+) Transcript_79619:261-878(+)
MLHQYSASGIEPMCSWSEASSSFAKKFSSHTKMPAVSTQSSRLMTAGMARLGSAAFIVDFTALTSLAMPGQSSTRMIRQAATLSMNASIPGELSWASMLWSSNLTLMIVGSKHTKSTIRIGVVKMPSGRARKWRKNSMAKTSPVTTSTNVKALRAAGPSASTSGIDSNIVFRILMINADWAKLMKTRPRLVCRFSRRCAAFCIVT